MSKALEEEVEEKDPQRQAKFIKISVIFYFVYGGAEQARGQTQQLRFSVWVSSGIAPVSDCRSASLLK